MISVSGSRSAPSNLPSGPVLEALPMRSQSCDGGLDGLLDAGGDLAPLKHSRSGAKQLPQCEGSTFSQTGGENKFKPCLSLKNS